MLRNSIIALILSIMIFIASLVVYIQGKDQQQTNLINISNYKIEVSVTNTNIASIDEQIETYIKEQKELFYHSVDITPYSEANLSIYSSSTTKNNLETITISSIITSNHQTRKDEITINYSLNEKKIITLQDILVSEDSMPIITSILYYDTVAYLNKQNIEIPSTLLDSVSKSSERFTVTEDGIKFTITINNSNTEIILSYAEINYMLKEEYRQSDVSKYERDLKEYQNKKLVAFTFDDGPSNYTTNLLLNNLPKYDAKVTFFVIGNRVGESKNTLKRAYQEGNQIGSHTYNHKNLIRLNEDQIRLEIEHTNSVVGEIIGEEPTAIRPPYGNINQTVKQYIHVPIIEWNIDTLDWKYKDKETIKNNIVDVVEDGDIILLHDIYESSVEGALLAMEELQKRGFAFVTIEEMMKLKGITWENGKNYYKF